MSSDMSKTRADVSHGSLVVETSTLEATRHVVAVQWWIRGRECDSRGIEHCLWMRLHVHDWWQSDHRRSVVL